MDTQKPVLVTTKHRGVFFGHVQNDAKLPNEITLTGARNAIYWSKKCNGFLGLAANGPSDECRIGAAVPALTLYDVTSITPVTDAAVKKWEAA